MKRILNSVLMLVILTTILFIHNTASAETSGTYGDLTYENFGDHIEITHCNKSAVSVDIPAEINGLPVTSIGNESFFDCGNLISINIPDSVTYIGTGAFRECKLLANFKISDNITYIGIGAFYDTAYYNNKSNWQDDVLYIEEYLIESDRIQGDYSIISGTLCIAAYAFNECQRLKNVEIPDGVVSICEGAFSSCRSMESINIPDSVIYIGTGAFSDCNNLMSIYISDNVSSIGEYAFMNCGRLNIEVSQQNNYFSSIDGVLFNKDKTEIISYAKDDLQKDYTIPKRFFA